jgi:hypothetical protein
MARTELWNIRIHEGQIAGNADLLIQSSGQVRGTFVFPAYGPTEETVTGQVSGSSIRLERRLMGAGPLHGKMQIWTGQYNANGSAAQGTAVNGGIYHWSATIVVH